MIGIVVAMQGEFEHIVSSSLIKLQEVPSSKYKQYTGYFYRSKVIVIISGVGKVRAASATQYLIDNYQPEKIINIGVCGATKGLKPVTTIEKVIEDDYDTSIFDNGVTIWHIDREGVIVGDISRDNYEV